MALNPASPNLGTGPTNQQGPFPQPGSTTPTTQIIGPLPASTMPGQLAQTIPVMANFQFLLQQLNNLQSQIVTAGPVFNGIAATPPLHVAPIVSLPLLPNQTIDHLTSGVVPGVYGDSTHSPQFVVNETGHLINVINVPIAGGGGGAGGGFLKGQEFPTSGTFTVPANVTAVWLTMIGGGSGGTGTSSGGGTGGGGGAAGEIAENVQVPVTALGTVTVTIGAGGLGGVSGVGTAGGITSFGSVYQVQGGTSQIVNAGATGGGPGGGLGGASGGSGSAGGLGVTSAPCYQGGGGGGGGAVSGSGGPGAGCGGYLGGTGGGPGGGKGGGGGGASTPWGPGGNGGAGETAGTAAPAGSHGAGGGGGGGNASTPRNGGAGQDGYCLVSWVGA